MRLALTAGFGPAALGVPLARENQRAVFGRAGGGMGIDVGEVNGGVNIGVGRRFAAFVFRWVLEDVISFQLEEDVIFVEGAGWLGGDDAWIFAVARCH